MSSGSTTGACCPTLGPAWKGAGREAAHRVARVVGGAGRVGGRPRRARAHRRRRVADHAGGRAAAAGRAERGDRGDAGVRHRQGRLPVRGTPHRPRRRPARPGGHQGGPVRGPHPAPASPPRRRRPAEPHGGRHGGRAGPAGPLPPAGRRGGDGRARRRGRRPDDPAGGGAGAGGGPGAGRGAAARRHGRRGPPLVGADRPGAGGAGGPGGRPGARLGRPGRVRGRRRRPGPGARGRRSPGRARTPPVPRARRRPGRRHPAAGPHGGRGGAAGPGGGRRLRRHGGAGPDRPGGVRTRAAPRGGGRADGGHHGRAAAPARGALRGPPAVTEPAAPAPRPEAPLTIEIDDLVVRHPASRERAALDGVSLRVAPGRRVAIVGPSGAGKSTLLAALMRLAEPESGSIRVNGVDLRELAGDDVRELMTGLTQDPYIFRASLRDNLRLAGPGADDERLRRAVRDARLDGWVERTGWDTELGEDGRTVSGGQLQRLALARALLYDPPVLLLDEPAEALDEETADRLMDDLLDVTRDRTTLLVTHRLKGLESVDEVIVLEDGRVTQRGRHDELVRVPGYYRDLWESEVLTRR
ncbi:ABC transporter ATP-binding protein [Nonomuraea salmonea]|uniref:amino acid ABC transporter ATP-binding/permease protein n=1 Tax=Nonomuraea salmonea TaxID=46181 RepID=UPI0031EEC8A6